MLILRFLNNSAWLSSCNEPPAFSIRLQSQGNSHIDMSVQRADHYTPAAFLLTRLGLSYKADYMCLRQGERHFIFCFSGRLTSSTTGNQHGPFLIPFSLHPIPASRSSLIKMAEQLYTKTLWAFNTTSLGLASRINSVVGTSTQIHFVEIIHTGLSTASTSPPGITALSFVRPVKDSEFATPSTTSTTTSASTVCITPALEVHCISVNSMDSDPHRRNYSIAMGIFYILSCVCVVVGIFYQPLQCQEGGKHTGVIWDWWYIGER